MRREQRFDIDAGERISSKSRRRFAHERQKSNTSEKTGSVSGCDIFVNNSIDGHGTKRPG